MCVGDDASKREVSTQPQLSMEPHAYRMLVAMVVHVCRSLGDDASKHEVSTQPQLSMESHAYRMFGVDCSARLSCGMVVLLVMTGCCRSFHNGAGEERCVEYMCAGIGQDVVLSITIHTQWMM